MGGEEKMARLKYTQHQAKDTTKKEKHEEKKT
jgi:hypothetical protein